MYKIFSSSFSVIMLIFAFGCLACKKTETKTPEDTLRISTNASPINVVPGSSFDFNVNVESAMPSAGVRISMEVVDEVDNVNYPQFPPVSSTSKTTQVQITGLPGQKYCVCTVTVYSKGNTDNKATASFRVLYK